MLETKKIGNKIAEARKSINISQAELAQQLFISPQAVGKWERGESMPDITTFDRLAEILGVDLNYFSANFKSSVTKMSFNESLENLSAELPTEKKKETLSWDMSRGNWVDADFSGLKNLQEKFSSSNMQRCKFNGSDLSGLLLKTNNVDGCDFSGSDISNSRIQSSNLANNVFKDSLLKEADFSKSNIERCDFSGTNLSGTKFSKSFLYACDFTGVNFTGVEIISGGLTGEKSKDSKKNTIINAIWNRTSFIETHIADIVLTGKIEDCYFENCEFTKVVFQSATLNNTFFKNNKKLKRIRFIDCKADRMTYEFLKQGKADLTGITLSAQLEGNEQ
ncbi:MAG: pentapeptide repeat-containing protein [Prolixibacteraceae bacterium]|nr:pentapeptide repeat-containing protein [Prolixibacteraceae bacterium]